MSSLGFGGGHMTKYLSVHYSSTMIKEQNQGLALELGGYLFKPRINKTSLDLSATMKSLQHRMPEMIAERKKEMEAKRREAAEMEVAECTFAPKRSGATTSNVYLAKAGRKKMTPEQLIQYEQEKQKRIEMRKQIIEEIESKELTFKPQLGEKSVKLQVPLAHQFLFNFESLLACSNRKNLYKREKSNAILSQKLQ